MKYLSTTILLLWMLLAPFKQDGLSLTYTAAEYPETNAYLHNPYRGFYHIYGYVLKNEVSYASLEDVPFIPNPETTQTVERLVLIQINLCRFSEEPIPELALEQLDMILDAWSRTEYAIILRFIYDWDGYAPEAEPSDINMILTHMEQTAKVYNKYADSIFTLQSLYTGNTGEMWNTNYGDKEDLALLGAKMAEVSDPSLYLSVRTPHQWRCVTGVDSYEELAALEDSPFLGRLGLFNDGMLGSSTDTGTYMTRSREEELAFQEVLCNTVPNGGEAIIDNPYNDLENAIRDMRLMHVSYLNSGHDAAVMDKWKNSTYSGEDVFHGVTGFEYIRNHLGYRYVLRSSELIVQGARGRHASLSLSIENVGFSVSYRRFSFLLTLVDAGTGETFSVSPDLDSTCLLSGKTTVLRLPLETSDYPPGTYRLYWQTRDDVTGEAIYYGNDIPLEDYGYYLGSLTIEASQE